MLDFDGPNKLITLDPSDLNPSAAFIYSRWKDWVHAGNAEFEAAFQVIGGEDLGGGDLAPSFFFLQNQIGWRIKPAETNANWTIEGNVFGADPLLPILLGTTGAFNTSIVINVASVAKENDTGSGLSTEQAVQLAAIYQYLGLDISNPKTITDTLISVGSISQSITEPDANTTLVSRT